MRREIFCCLFLGMFRVPDWRFTRLDTEELEFPVGVSEIFCHNPNIAWEMLNHFHSVDVDSVDSDEVGGGGRNVTSQGKVWIECPEGFSLITVKSLRFLWIDYDGDFEVWNAATVLSKALRVLGPWSLYLFLCLILSHSFSNYSSFPPTHTLDST